MAVPKIWSRFSAVGKHIRTEFKFRIQEATIDNYEEVIHFVDKYYIGSETLCTAAGIHKSKDARKEICGLYDLTKKDNLTLICYPERGSKVGSPVAVCLLPLLKASDVDKDAEIISKVKTPEVKKYLNTVRVMNDLSGGMKTLGFDKWYYPEMGVNPDYSGLGIGREIIKLLNVIAKENGVPAIIAWLTAMGTQKETQRVGWKTAYEIPFNELGRLTDSEFIGTPPTCKLAYMLITE